MKNIERQNGDLNQESSTEKVIITAATLLSNS